MKKRKLLSLVTIGFVVLYLLSALTFAFMSWELSENEKMRVGDSYTLQMEEDLHEFLKGEDADGYTQEDFDELLYRMSYLYSTENPTLFALIDNNTNEIVARSKNIVYFYKPETNDGAYVDVEPYLTDEIKEELVNLSEEINT